ncbi:MAG: hypothetical protein D6725_17635 [Planctomycetota bacterium]|nr:MAG: hypothetical protein D6725_17635 [Planctomycetota bacterium]
MNNWMSRFWNDDAAMVVSAELVIIGTIAVLAMVVGLQAVARAVNTEMTDMANALYGLRQTYAYTGFRSGTFGKPKSFVSGGAFWAEQGNWQYATIVGGDAYVAGGSAADQPRSVELQRRSGSRSCPEQPCPPGTIPAPPTPCDPCQAAPPARLDPEPERDRPTQTPTPGRRSRRGDETSGVELSPPEVTRTDR